MAFVDFIVYLTYRIAFTFIDLCVFIKFLFKVGLLNAQILLILQEQDLIKCCIGF